MNKQRPLSIPIRAVGAPVQAAPVPEAVRTPDPASSRSIVLEVPAMCCAAEFGAVERELRRLDGVRDVRPDFLRRLVRVDHDGIEPAALLQAAGRSGFDARLPAAPSEAAPATQQRSTLAIPGMCCPSEAAMIEKRLAAEPGLADELQFDTLQRRVSLSHAPGALPRVLAALEEIGLGGQVVAPRGAVAPEGEHAGHPHGHVHEADGHPHGHVHETAEPAAPSASPAAAVARSAYLKLGAAAALAIGAEAAGYLAGDRSLLPAVLALAAIALCGLGVFAQGWRALRHGQLTINALMSIAVTGAALIGHWPEAAMVMVLFALAERIEARSLERARQAVASLMALAPETATVQTPDGWRTLPAAAVRPGAIVRARPGERIALDGTVTAGASALDQSPITGESVPVDKAAGDPLFAGSINQNGELEYRVTAAASESTLARIIHAVEEAQSSRAPTQRFVDAFARVYTPVVFAAALALALVPPLAFGGDWATWVYRALVMLVVACPCALVLSTPVTVVSGLTAAARRGILIKGGLYLEQGHRLKSIALDKTGTLTRGRPSLVEVLALDGPEDAALSEAVALAARSDHPVSQAIARAAPAGGALPAVDGFAALPGLGIEGQVGGLRLRLGNQRLVRESGAASPALDQRLDALERAGRTAVVLLRGDRPAAIFAIADALRPESAAAVEDLKALGIRPVMLTGDNRHTAEAIARQLGIDDVRSELLPADKLAAIESMGGTRDAAVGMVGDGINDAPALARADIGFAMGAAGTDTAIETADVALMDDDPRKLAEFVRLARATRRVLWQNIAIALGLKMLFLALAAAGYATLWMAVFADVGSSVIVVFNGLRLLRLGRRPQADRRGGSQSVATARA